MQNVHPTVRQFVAPFAPPPATPEEIEALCVRADLEYQQHREASRAHRALQDQQQHLQNMGVLS